MKSPFPRACLWLVITHVAFEPAVTAGFLATVGFEHAPWALAWIIPLSTLKLLLSTFFMWLYLAPARALAALPPAQQAQRPDVAATAVEAVLRFPYRFALTQAALWFAQSLPVTLLF